MANSIRSGARPEVDLSLPEWERGWPEFEECVYELEDLSVDSLDEWTWVVLKWILLSQGGDWGGVVKFYGIEDRLRFDVFEIRSASFQAALRSRRKSEDRSKEKARKEIRKGEEPSAVNERHKDRLEAIYARCVPSRFEETYAKRTVKRALRSVLSH
ncbi:hypothetical protein JIN87_04375 [Pelagicoccus mobilis]|uniref:Uncharacterized protein n=2 Tax=Pelagicoccus mobilis TaxID=415221 RepID=A0A934RVA7_9BACT|nr:hypothetical protein [Pelagicoccus mobilis]